MTAETSTRDAFLSHRSKDKLVVRSLAERLRQGGRSRRPEAGLLPPKRLRAGGFDERAIPEA